VNFWHNALLKPGIGGIKTYPKRDLIRKEKSGTERNTATAASLYKRRARWKWRSWRILNGRVSIDFLFKKWEVDSALLRFLTVQWRNLPLIVYWLFQFNKSFHVFFTWLWCLEYFSVAGQFHRPSVLAYCRRRNVQFWRIWRKVLFHCTIASAVQSCQI